MRSAILPPTLMTAPMLNAFFSQDDVFFSTEFVSFPDLKEMLPNDFDNLSSFFVLFRSRLLIASLKRLSCLLAVFSPVIPPFAIVFRLPSVSSSFSSASVALVLSPSISIIRPSIVSAVLFTSFLEPFVERNHKHFQICFRLCVGFFLSSFFGFLVVLYSQRNWLRHVFLRFRS